ncbi:MAG: L,D-transpeptidase family protein [Hyphomicrobiaceae bacterium]|nr:L,D-transpeptidase family protein [Hyphomicrobiaceae bacterium]MCC0024123.1 L,D-transpeptidase family protein [Hyphomicrobiaceae bacterium]
MTALGKFKLALIPAILGAALLANPAVQAQEKVTIDGVEAERVIIAPPLNPLALSIKKGLAEAYAQANPESRAYEEAQKLYFFYGGRHFEPLWLTSDDNGKVAFSDKAEQIIQVFKDSYLEGLRPDDYLTADLSLDADMSNPDAVARLETAFSAAAIKYAQNAYGGRVRPSSVSGYIDIRPPQLDGAKFLLELAASDTPDQMLHDLSPTNPEFLGLKKLLAQHYAGTIEKVVSIPGGGLLKPGMSDDRVPLLRERLELDPIEGSTTYDDLLVAAVESFQEEKGLTVDGVIGPATVSALNGGSAIPTVDIVANMERWRWMPRDLGNFNVFVNIPEFRLYIYDNGQQAYTTRVVVGKISNQTPIFNDEIEHIVMNPYWNVPPSIASNEIGPILQSNPGYIASHNMELLSGGRVINASAVDWSTNSINNFRIRQKPGGANALGQVKFLFPNSHDVYLHDTPSKSLFSRSTRAFSHGCVRVQNPMDFANALLANEPRLSLATLESERGSTERWNNLEYHVPVHLAYFTLRVDANGNVQSFPDIYGHNAKLVRMLDAS